MCLEYLLAEIQSAAADDLCAVVDPDDRAPRAIAPPILLDIGDDAEEFETR
jgi:hypothetical protein